MRFNWRGHCTDDSLQGYDTSDIHLSAGGPLPCEVPVQKLCQSVEWRRERAQRQMSTDEFDGDCL